MCNEKRVNKERYQEKQHEEQLSDESLLQKYYAGDDRAYHELIRRNADWLQSQAERRLRNLGVPDPRTTALDLVQDTVFKVWRSKKHHVRWNPVRGEVKAWLNAILRSKAIELARKKSPQLATDMESKQADDLHNFFENQVSSACSPFENAVLAEQQERVRLSCSLLDEPYRSIIRMKYWKGLSQRDIAKELGLTDLQIHRSVAAAQRILRESLTEGKA